MMIFSFCSKLNWDDNFGCSHGAAPCLFLFSFFGADNGGGGEGGGWRRDQWW